MTSLILLNHLVPDIGILKNAIKVPYVESEHLVSDIIESDSGTHELDQKIVNNISNLDSSITTIAVLYENIRMIPDGFEVLCASLPQHIKTIDLLTCNLNDEESITILKTLESRYNKIIRYSVDLTGHEDSMGNWMLESHNVSVRNIYFNNKITEWKHVLVYTIDTDYYYRMWNSIYDVNHNRITYYRTMTKGVIYSGKLRTDITTLKSYTTTPTNITGLYIPPNIIDWEYNAFYFDKDAICTTYIVDSNVFSTVDISTGYSWNVPFGECFSTAPEKTIFILWKDIPGRFEPYVSNIYHPNYQSEFNTSNLVFVRLRTYAPPEYTLKVIKNNTIPLPQHLEYRQFSFSDFSGIDFSNTSFKNSILFSVNLSNANLSDADLSNADLTNANLNGADLSGAVLDGTVLNGADFTGVNIAAIGTKGPIQGSPIIPDEWMVLYGYFKEIIVEPGADLSNVNIKKYDFAGVKSGPLDGSAPSSLPAGYKFVSGNNEQWIIGPGVDLSGADLSGVDFSGVKTGPLVGSAPSSLPYGYEFVSGTNDQFIIGPGVHLSGVDLHGIDFSNLDLTTVILSGAKTWPLLGTAPSLPSGYTFVSGTYEKGIIGPGVDLSDVDLTGVIFSGADLSGADLSNIDFFNIKTGPLVGTAPTLSNEYTFVSGTNEQWIIGYGVDLSGADLSGANVSDVILSGVNLNGVKTGSLIGSAPSSLSDGYDFISGNNEQWIVGPGVDLSGADLSGADLSGADLSDINLTNANLSGTKTSPLSETTLSSLPSGYEFISGTNENLIVGPNADLIGADLSGVDLTGVDLTNANLSGTKTGPLIGTSPSLPTGYTFVSGTNEQWIIGPGVDLNGADLSGADLSNIDLTNVKSWPLVGTAPSSLPPGYHFVSGTNEKGIIRPYADLTGADLSGVDLTGVDLTNANLSGTKTGPLIGTSPSLPSGYTFVSGTNEQWIIGPGVDLNGADLSGADLSNIDLTNVKSWPLVGTAPSLPTGHIFVSGTNEKGIIRPNADLTGADLSGVDLTGVDLTNRC